MGEPTDHETLLRSLRELHEKHELAKANGTVAVRPAGRINRPVSTRRAKWRGCESKLRYDTEYAAQAVISSRSKKEGKRLKLRVYGCGECGGFHLTHT
jgi:hypothetical protein